MVGFISSRFGRKGGLLLNNVLVIIATLLLGLAKTANSFQMLIAGRLVIGINSGLNAGLAPMYLAEISPTSLRGAVSVHDMLSHSNIQYFVTAWNCLPADYHLVYPAVPSVGYEQCAGYRGGLALAAGSHSGASSVPAGYFAILP